MGVGAESPALVSTEQVGETEVETRQRLFNRIAPMYDTVRFFFSQTQILPGSKIFRFYFFCQNQGKRMYVSHQSLWMSHLSLNEIVELIILLSVLFAPKPTKSTKPWNNAAPFAKTGFLRLQRMTNSAS
jgi:hypothetical protein